MRSGRLNVQRQRGQAMVEYTVVTSALVFALVTAGPGSVDYVKEAINTRNKAYTYTVSLSTYPNTEDLTKLAEQYARDNLDPDEIAAVATQAGLDKATGAFDDYINSKFPVPLKLSDVDPSQFSVPLDPSKISIGQILQFAGL